MLCFWKSAKIQKVRNLLPHPVAWDQKKFFLKLIWTYGLLSALLNAEQAEHMFPLGVEILHVSITQTFQLLHHWMTLMSRQIGQLLEFRIKYLKMWRYIWIFALFYKWLTLDILCFWPENLKYSKTLKIFFEFFEFSHYLAKV